MPQVSAIPTDNQELPAAGYNDQHIKSYRHGLGLRSWWLIVCMHTAPKNFWHGREKSLTLTPNSWGYHTRGNDKFSPKAAGRASVRWEPLNNSQGCWSRSLAGITAAFSNRSFHCSLFPSLKPYTFLACCPPQRALWHESNDPTAEMAVKAIARAFTCLIGTQSIACPWCHVAVGGKRVRLEVSGRNSITLWCNLMKQRPRAKLRWGLSITWVLNKGNVYREDKKTPKHGGTKCHNSVKQRPNCHQAITFMSRSDRAGQHSSCR